MTHAPDLRHERDDVQAMLRTGFNLLPHSAFWLLTVESVGPAKAWLDQLLRDRLVKSAGEVSRRSRSDGPLDEAVGVAFTAAGLAKLGVVGATDFPFSTPFTSGMSSPIRERLMRDDPRDGWHWGDTPGGGRQLVHVLVFRWWRPDRLAGSHWVDPGAAQGFAATCVQGDPAAFCTGKTYEPFGFRDGVSQPSFRGLDDPDTAAPAASRHARSDDDFDVAAGEFILGHPNQYRQTSACPDVEGWAGSRPARRGVRFGLNGSYLAVRQIEQDVAAFRALTTGLHAGPPGCPGDTTAAERLIGRRRDAAATPLGWEARTAFPATGSGENFGYRLDDGDGFLCARGAHVRRVNPRDSLGHDTASGLAASKLHRLLRRGRAYVDATGGEGSSGPKRGIFFVACNADLERQFEFVHQRWLRNPRFGGLNGKDDPIVGSARAGSRLSVPGLPLGQPIDLASFTRAVGGGYFFLPGLRALRFIVSDEAREAASSPPPGQPAGQ